MKCCCLIYTHVGCYSLQHNQRHGVAEGGAEDGVEGAQVRPADPHPAGGRGALHLRQATPRSFHQVRATSKLTGMGTPQLVLESEMSCVCVCVCVCDSLYKL